MKIFELFESQTDKEIKQEISAYINATYEANGKKRRFGRYKIVDGKVNMDDSFILNAHLLKDGKIPFQFGRTGYFQVATKNLTSLWELPREVSTIGSTESFLRDAALSFKCDLPAITNLEGITPIIHGGLWMGLMQNCTLKDIHKHVKKMNGLITIYQDYSGPMLGAMKIPGCKGYSCVTMGNNVDKQARTVRAKEIINSCIEHHIDILECQEKLLEAGLKEYAKL